MVKDYGFEENDIQFLFITMDEKKIEIGKTRNWFFNADLDEQDYDVTYSILVDGKVFMTFPKEVDRSVVRGFAYTQFEPDPEATKEIHEMHSIMDSERRFGC